MATSLLALGANVGDRRATLDRAVELLAGTPGVSQVVSSRWYATAPVGGPSDQGEFLNGVAKMQTTLAPPALLALIRDIERQLGRQRSQRWAARTLDLDLLLHDNLVLDTPDLELPHPRMPFRRFVLEPAVEIAAEMVHPLLGWTVEKLFDHLQHAAHYLAVDDRRLRANLSEYLAREVAQRCGGQLIYDPQPELTDPAAYRDLASFRHLLHRRAAMLPKTDSDLLGRWHVSNFWLPALLDLAEERLSTDELAEFSREFHSESARLMRPKALARVEAHAIAAPYGSQQNRHQGDAPWPYPMLRLSPIDAQMALDELLAVASGMR